MKSRIEDKGKSMPLKNNKMKSESNSSKGCLWPCSRKFCHIKQKMHHCDDFFVSLCRKTYLRHNIQANNVLHAILCTSAFITLPGLATNICDSIPDFLFLASKTLVNIFLGAFSFLSKGIGSQMQQLTHSLSTVYIVRYSYLLSSPQPVSGDMDDVGLA
jgi:hypothetical protein